MKFKFLIVCVFFTQSVNGLDDITLKTPYVLDRHVQRHIKKIQKKHIRNSKVVHVYTTSSPEPLKSGILANVTFLDN